MTKGGHATDSGHPGAMVTCRSLSGPSTADREHRQSTLCGHSGCCPEAAALSGCNRGWRRLATLLRMNTLIETHRAELLALARRRGVTGVRVFGSMSRGDGSDNSDVDLLVTLAPGISALALGGLLMDAQDLLGRRVDVVTESSLHPALRDSVVAGAVWL